MTKKQLLIRINAAKRRIAKERDILRDLIDEGEAIAMDIDEAVEDIERAADTLSRLL